MVNSQLRLFLETGGWINGALRNVQVKEKVAAMEHWLSKKEKVLPTFRYGVVWYGMVYYIAKSMVW